MSPICIAKPDEASKSDEATKDSGIGWGALAGVDAKTASERKRRLAAEDGLEATWRPM